MDVFETKGIQYLIAMGYLILLTLFYWWFVRRSEAEFPAEVPVPGPIGHPVGNAWFNVPEGFHFHRGHTWARRESEDVFRVGMADFAQKLVGKPDTLCLPETGRSLEEGRPGWSVQLHGESLDLLSPLSGVVVETNPEALADPGSVCEDPYGRGWLLKVKTARPATALANLLPSELARVWTTQTAARLNSLMGSEVGAVLQDGGVPVSGFARELSNERWHEIAAQLLLTSDETESKSDENQQGTCGAVCL